VEREEEKAQEEEKVQEEVRGSINFGLAAEIVQIVANFRYASKRDVAVVEDVASDMADMLVNFFGTGLIEYPADPTERKIRLEERPPIPLDVFFQIEQYITNRIAPQTFVLYCLQDDITMAARIGQQQFHSATIIDAVMDYIHKRAPAECWGSVSRVIAWLNEPGYLDDSSRR